MNAWVIFRRARIVLFFILILICLTWAILFAIFLSHGWTDFSLLQKVIATSLVSLYVSTAVFLYLMVVVHFRLWWDVVRVFGLLVVHTGSCVLFTQYRPSFPCRGFSTESVCREFIYTIFIGCWALSGIILCFAISLGVIAFIPRPVDPSPGIEEDDAPTSPASFHVGSPTDKRLSMSFYSFDARTGLVTYKNGGKLPEESLSLNSNPSPADSAHRETINMEPPRLWQGFPSPNLRHSNETSTYGGTKFSSIRNVPRERVGVVSESLRVDTFYRNPFGDSSPSPVSIFSRASMIGPGVARKKSSVPNDRPDLPPAYSEPKHDALSPIPLLSSPHPVTSPRDRATEYTPTLYSILNHYTFPESPEVHSQGEQKFPDKARPSSVHSFHSSAASVHSMWAESAPHVLPLLVLTPDIARFRGFSPYLGPEDPSSGNNTSFAARGSVAPLRPKRKVSEPGRTVQRYGELSAHQSYIPSVKEKYFLRRGSDMQALDEPQWWRLVLTAAAKPRGV